MRRDLLLVVLLLLPATWGLTASELGIDDQNIARIADFNNDLQLDILAFSDRIDTRLSNISVYYGPGFDTKVNVINGSFARCSIDYGDADNDSYLEIVGSCFNSSNQSVYFNKEFNGTGWENTSRFEPGLNQSFTTSSYGDTIQLDFTGDGFDDVISCMYIDTDDLALFVYNTTQFTSYESGIPAARFQTSGVMSNCYLTPIDFDADNDFDLIAYTYDDSNFTLYNNTGNGFLIVEDQTYFNLTYFQNRLIKHIQAYDSGDGFPDLYFIIDENNSASPRNITFGYFPNQHRTFDDRSISAPTQTVSYILDNSSFIQASWNLFNDSNQLIVNLSGGDFYNINVSPLFAADIPQTNYDHKAKYGNLQSRSSLNFSVAHQCFNVSTQAISKNLLVSSFSSPNVTPLTLLGNSIELCDGYDNDCDGLVDEPFNFTWPGGANTTIDFDEDGDKYYPYNKTLNNAFNGTDYELVISCIPRKDNLNSSTTNTLFFDPDDDDPNLKCGNGESTCDLTIVDNSVDTNTGSSGSSGGGTIGNILGTTQEETTTDETETTQSDPEPEQQTPPPIQPQTQSPQGSSPNQKIQENFDLIKSQPYRIDRRIEFIGGRTRVTETVTNRYIYTLEDMRAIITIPKEVEQSASNIISSIPFTIIEEDPIIAFDINDLTPRQEFSYTYTINDLTQAQGIQTQIQYNELSEDEVLAIEQEDRRKQQETQEVVNTTINYVVEDNTTTFNIDFEFDEDNVILNNYTIFYHIPDCLLQVIEEEAVQTNKEFTIIKKDPMVAWHFDQLTDTDQIQLQINAIADTDCIEQARIVRSVAQEIINIQKLSEGDLEIWPPIIVTIILFILLYVLSGFTKRNTITTMKQRL